MNELARALISTSAFASPANLLQGIPEAIAHTKPAGAPHSIYAEVWHTAYWQAISLDWVQGKPTPVPEHAAEGFPANTDEPWETLLARFLAGTQNAAAIAQDTDRLEVVVSCPTIGDEGRTMSIHDQLVSLAAHNAYHLGRIVLLRQLLNHWPPPDGGYTW
jgi:uncharacterized damage-inducible protein DinB